MLVMRNNVRCWSPSNIAIVQGGRQIKYFCFSERYCIQNIPPVIVSRGHELYIHFRARSDAKATSQHRKFRGFYLTHSSGKKQMSIFNCKNMDINNSQVTGIWFHSSYQIVPHQLPKIVEGSRRVLVNFAHSIEILLTLSLLRTTQLRIDRDKVDSLRHQVV